MSQMVVTAAPHSEGGQVRAYRSAGVFSRGIARWPTVATLLGAERIVQAPSDAQAQSLDCVLTWGTKRSGEKAEAYAQRHGLPLLRLEDGFLRSVGLGVHGEPPLSLLVDDEGIYYDASRPSQLERMLQGEGAQPDPLENPQLLARAKACMARIVEAKLSKYNDSSTLPVELPGAAAGPQVLVVDQTYGDQSIARGLASPASFEAMMQHALDAHPEAQLLIKTHPDVLAGKKKSCLSGFPDHPRVRVIATPCNPLALLEQVVHVYTVTSQLGFEALLVGKPVTCFGAPFYAGWGLTQDQVPVARRTRRRSLEQVFAAAYLLYPRYLDPETGQPGQIEQVLDYLAVQRRMFAVNAGHLVCVGFSRWKRPYAKAYLRGPDTRISFARSARHAAKLASASGARLVVWGAREPQELKQLAADRALPLWRMEDGFLRSVELGSNLTAPASLVVDMRGIYYDPTSPSALEEILETAELSEQELQRAAALRRAILAARISKYNLGQHQPIGAGARPGQCVVLVPGQVEDDASIRLGCVDVRTNEALLRAVRRLRPEAHVVYKPHPDVVSGNRQGHVPDEVLREVADEVVPEAQLADCLDRADEVHTMTSLVGFEALLREKPAVVFGVPFYAGWGLTQDQAPEVPAFSRRTRRLTLDALVAGVLIRYPRYLSGRTGRFTTPEAIVGQLQRARDARAGDLSIARSWPSRQLRRVTHAIKGIVGAR